MYTTIGCDWYSTWWVAFLTGRCVTRNIASGAAVDRAAETTSHQPPLIPAAYTLIRLDLSDGTIFTRAPGGEEPARRSGPVGCR